jgi:hypothetical protein
VLAFWDGESRGTRGGLEYAKNRGKQIMVVHVSWRNNQAIEVCADTASTGLR